MQDTYFHQGRPREQPEKHRRHHPRDKLVVLTGLSGSGKVLPGLRHHLCRGQRRYVESLSSYARMFLGQMEKPDVDYIDGLPRHLHRPEDHQQEPRSTVGTVTEIYDYLRLLWARVGTPTAPSAARRSASRPSTRSSTRSWPLPEGTRIQVLAPVVRGKKGEHAKVLEDARRSGYVRVRVDGVLYELTEDIPWRRTRSTTSRSWWTGWSSGRTSSAG